MSKLDGGDIFVRAIEAEGVKILFGIADISYIPIFRAAEARGLKIVGGRHESANVHMADGWARTTGEVAVALGAMGPGVANLVPGVITAWIEGIPVLVVGTQRTTRIHDSILRGKFQHTPQLDVFRPVTKFAAIVPDAAHIGEYVREAFRHMLTGRPGPAYLEINDDVLRQKVADSDLEWPKPLAYRTSPPGPDPALIDEAARILYQAAAPLIIAGDGVARSGAEGALWRIVERTGAMAASSVGSRGLLPEDRPQVLALMNESAREAGKKADVVFFAGAQPNELMGLGREPRWAPSGKQIWIQLDSDPLMIGVNRPIEIALVGDAKKGLEALDAALASRGPQRPMGETAKKISEALQAERNDLIEKLGRREDAPIHPARLAFEVGGYFGPNAIACFDGGNTVVWAHLFHRFLRPRSFLWTSHFGHLGTGLPYAVAAKLAAPDRPVYLFTGDGALGFNLQEMETAARARANIVVVVNCDYAFAMEHLGQVTEMGKIIGVRTSPIRFDQIAQGMGWHGERVERPDAIRPALERASGAGKPALVQVNVNPDFNIEPPGLLELGRMYAGITRPWETPLNQALGYVKYKLGGGGD